jgi:hypothetical protein
MNFEAATPENTSTEPIEMSKPPPTMTNVMPTAMICNIATSSVMLRTLATVGNESGRRMAKTTIKASSTQPM